MEAMEASKRKVQHATEGIMTMRAAPHGISPDEAAMSTFQAYTLQPQDVVMGDLISKGATGDVWAGTLNVPPLATAFFRRDAVSIPVAIKVISATSGTSTDQFMLESLRIQVLHAIRFATCLGNHLGAQAHICRYYGVFVEEHVTYIVMRRYKQSLGQYIADWQPGGLPVAECLRIGLQIAEGLQAVHSCDMVYRDLKPGNLLMDDAKNIVLCDFGISKSIRTTLGASTSSQRMDVAHYMSPEQWGQGGVTLKADIWAAGATLLYLLTGRQPVSGMEALQISKLSRDKSAPTIPAGLDSGISMLLRKCFSFEAAHRPSAKQLVSQLKDLLHQHTTGARSPSTRDAQTSAHIPDPCIGLTASPSRPQARHPVRTPSDPGPNTRPIAHSQPPATSLLSPGVGPAKPSAPDFTQPHPRVTTPASSPAPPSRSPDPPTQPAGPLNSSRPQPKAPGSSPTTARSNPNLVSAALARWPRLRSETCWFQSRTLSLRNQNLALVDVTMLASALATNTSLQELDLYFNCLGVEGAKVLAKALETNTTLRKLGLGYNNCGAEGAKALAAALESNCALQQLDLGYNSLGDEGALALVGPLAFNTSLMKLKLRGNLIREEGAKALAGLLEFNVSLKELDLRHNLIGAEGGSALAVAQAAKRAKLSANTI